MKLPSLWIEHNKHLITFTMTRTQQTYDYLEELKPIKVHMIIVQFMFCFRVLAKRNFFKNITKTWPLSEAKNTGIQRIVAQQNKFHFKVLIKQSSFKQNLTIKMFDKTKTEQNRMSYLPQTHMQNLMKQNAHKTKLKLKFSKLTTHTHI